MVRRVCRSLLADPNDAEDVFQATFLVLARKAGTIRRPELLGNWLYGTAHRTARTLKTRAARRLKHEAREAAMAHARASTDPDGLERQAARREEAAVVHEEVARLPEACRTAVVLCDLEGRTQEEVAHLLRCSDRTLRRRLDRARDLLRARLTRRGLAPTAGVLAAALGPEPASAAIPQITVDATARAAIRFAAGPAADRHRLNPGGRSDHSHVLDQAEDDARLHRVYSWPSGLGPGSPWVSSPRPTTRRSNQSLRRRRSAR